MTHRDDQTPPAPGSTTRPPAAGSTTRPPTAGSTTRPSTAAAAAAQTVDDHVRRLLSTPGRWAVVGLSTNQARAAYDVAAYLQSLGHEIVPVHPRAETVHGCPGYRTLEEIPGPIDVVDVFVGSALAGAVVDSAVRLGVPAVWLQLGVHDAAAEAAAREAGVTVIADTCPKIEGPRFGLGVVRRPRPVPRDQA